MTDARDPNMLGLALCNIFMFAKLGDADALEKIVEQVEAALGEDTDFQRRPAPDDEMFFKWMYLNDIVFYHAVCLERRFACQYLRQSAKNLARVSVGDDPIALHRKGGVAALEGSAQAMERGAHYI